MLRALGAPPELAYEEDAHVTPFGTVETASAIIKLKYSKTKARLKIVADKWGRVLTQMGITSKVYDVEGSKIVFVAERGFNDMIRIREYVLAQKETVEFEWKQKKYYPNVSRDREFKRAMKQAKRAKRLERLEQEKKIRELQEAAAAPVEEIEDVSDEFLNEILAEVEQTSS
jgi:hypothetical protein